MTLTGEECSALIELIDHESILIINDNENEFWNEIRRKLRYIKSGGVTCDVDGKEVDCETWT